MALKPPKNDRRRFGRRRLLCHALVQIDRQQPIPCQVSDLSSEGASLRFTNEAPAAKSFRLIIEDEGVDVLCEVRHRQYGSIGVFFTTPKLESVESARQIGNAIAQEFRENLVELTD